MERKHQLLIIGLVGILLLGAIAWLNFGLSRSRTGSAKGRDAFAEASPTPKPNARQKADVAGQISSVEGSTLVGIRQMPAPEPVPVVTEKSKPKKVNYGMVQFFSAAPKARPAATPVPDPAWYLPRATLIPCSLVLTVDSSSRDTPVLGEVTQDVKMFGGTGQVAVPAGTLVAGFASPGRVRNRIEVKGSWDLIFKDGKEYEFRGVACDRIYDYATGRYGLTDGSAGLQGTILYTDQYAEIKAFAAGALSGAAQAYQTTNATFAGNTLERTPQNAGLQGLSSVSNLMVEKYLRANEGDETYVRVPAGKEFYVYTLSVIEPGQSSVGAYAQDAQAQTIWERVQAETKNKAGEAMSPEVSELLTQMARQQRTVQELKRLSAGQGEGEAGNAAKTGF
ncbi:MAG: hypothetical protein JO069_23105 [Verrucomicrobia bacterium]|nr:hypothetical protein [Verrucomicrobiota bacterium]